MYTILMQADGGLICTSPNAKIRRTENLVDSFHIIVPKKYKDVELIDFQATAKYVDPANTPRIEMLNLNNDNYKTDYLEYVLPVTTLITRLPGDVHLYLTFTKPDEDEKKIYMTHSSEIIIHIENVNDYFTDESSFMGIDKRIIELQKLADSYDKNKADNIEKDGNRIYLTSNGEQIGNTIVVTEGGKDDFTVIQF